MTQVPVERICGQRSPSGRFLCLRKKGHERDYHMGGDMDRTWPCSWLSRLVGWLKGA